MTDKDEKSHTTTKKNDDDSKLWALVTKDVEPLDKKPVSTVNTKKPEHTAKKRARTAAPPPETKKGPEQDPQLDRRTEQRLKRGQLPIDGRIDLHGKTQTQAFDALSKFITNAYTQKKRCLLVITGKGNWQEGGRSIGDEKTGVLRQKTPEWLSSAPLSQYILRVEPARPNHGGEGALYVLLRRQR